jgi:hypothetical protein
MVSDLNNIIIILLVEPDDGSNHWHLIGWYRVDPKNRVHRRSESRLWVDHPIVEILLSFKLSELSVVLKGYDAECNSNSEAIISVDIDISTEDFTKKIVSQANYHMIITKYL